MKDNRSYYDDFSSWYERGRSEGYHAYLDRAQLRLIEPYLSKALVCEVGCGTGLILKEVAPKALHCVGIDLSRKMLAPAQARQLKVVQSTATELPFSDGSFDLVYSFKVLPHVEQIERALAEVARILKPGGKAFLSRSAADARSAHNEARCTPTGVYLINVPFAAATASSAPP